MKTEKISIKELIIKADEIIKIMEQNSKKLEELKILVKEFRSCDD